MSDLTVGSLEEFRALRAEIDRRSNSQQAIAGLQLTAAATAVGVAGSDAGSSPILFALGPVSFFLALAWVDHHLAVEQIGRYIRTVIENRGLGLGWEGWLADRKLGAARRLWRLVAPAVLLFVLPPIAALVWLALAAKHWPALGVTGWTVDLVVTLGGGAVVFGTTNTVDQSLPRFTRFRNCVRQGKSASPEGSLWG
jgi:hypothetical protein